MPPKKKAKTKTKAKEVSVPPTTQVATISTPQVAVMGRPTEYDPKYCEMLVEHMSTGLSFDSFGGIARVSRQTLYTWTEKHPEFLDSKKLGESLGLVFWEKAGFQGMFGNKEIPFNSTVWVFSMKNRFGWKDKQDIDLNANVKSSLIRDDLSKKSTAELLEIMEKAKAVEIDGTSSN